MKKHLFWLAALTLSMAACTKDTTPGGLEGDKVANAVGSSKFIELVTENGRFQYAAEDTTTPTLPEGTKKEDDANGAWLTAPDHLVALAGGADVELDNTSYYSATGIAYDETTGTVYVCWHSNRMDDVDEDSDSHSHGTNVDENATGNDVVEPSLKDANDWGGIVDIIKFSASENNIPDVEPATKYDLKGEFIASYWQPEHKYNHVVYNGGLLYLASTSWYVGAALHTVPVTPEGFTTTEAVRYNLTGNSANCVALVGDDVVTVSGRTNGGVNWFNTDDVVAEYKDGNNTAFNLTSKSVNETNANFGGKHIWVDVDNNNTVYVLRNPDAPVIDVYEDGESKGEFIKLEGVKLAPIDGKNVLFGDDKYLYACCGYYGLQVIDKTEKKVVATSAKEDRHADNMYAQPWNKYYTANGVDVDDEYIYVASGAGLAVFEYPKEKADGELDLNKDGGLKLKKYATFTGTNNFDGFAKNKKTADGEIKESSNFVKVISVAENKYAFVAYGMYGLRIYDLSTLEDDAE